MNSAKSLGKLKAVDAVPALRILLSDESEHARLYASYALASCGDPRDLGRLINALKLDDPDIRFRAAPLLGEVGDRRAVKALIAQLHTDNACNAAGALGHLADGESEPALRRCLNDPDRSVRYNAVWALGRIGDHASVPALHARALVEEDEQVKELLESVLHSLAMEPLKPVQDRR